MRKKLISIDLDGVLNTYNGNYSETVISPIKEGAYEFLETLFENYVIEIFTVRDAELTKRWLEANNISQFVNKVTDIKNPFASVILDDRAINFDGSYEKALCKIENFKPYWKV